MGSVCSTVLAKCDGTGSRTGSGYRSVKGRASSARLHKALQQKQVQMTQTTVTSSSPRIFSVLSAILYLGNVTYKKRATGRDEGLEVGPPEVLDTLSKLLKVPPVSIILSCPCFLAAQWGSLPSPRQWQSLSTGDKWGTSVCCLLPCVISEMSPSCCCLCLSVYVCLATYTV